MPSKMINGLNYDPPRTATFVVAASDASAQFKLQADYICDGTADDVQIQEAIDALPASGGRVVLSEGIFTVNDRIDVSSNTTLSGSGWGTILRVVPATFPDNISVIRLSSVSESIVRDLLIDGEWDNGRVNNDLGIELRDCTDCLVENVYVMECRGQGIVTGGTSTTRCNISNCILYHNEHRGINIGQEATHILVSDCQAIDNAYSGFLVGSDGISATFIEFVNCIVKEPSGANTAPAFVIQAGSDHCKLTNCISYMSNHRGFEIAGDYCSLVNCGSYNSEIYGYEVSGSHSSLVNCVSYKDTTYGFFVTGDYSKLVGCLASFTSGAAVGINIYLGTGNTVEACTAEYSDRYGIRVSDCSFTKLVNNIARNNSQETVNSRDGISILANGGRTVEYTTVIGNTCFDDQDSISSLLTTDAANGQPDVIVADGTLFFEGQWVTISDDTPDTENNQILSISGNTLTMAVNLVNDYTVAQNAVVTGRKTQEYGYIEEAAGTLNYTVLKDNVFIGNATGGIGARIGANNTCDIEAMSIALDLTGGATDIEVFHAKCPCVLTGYVILYSIATGGGAGVNIRVGRYQDGVALDDNYFDTTVSEVNKAKGYSKHFATAALTQAKIAAGDTITVGTAGAKADTGEVIVILEIAEMAD
ncbi:MAG: right-handed parallel beta-helix repeat-containing protein [Dehalococcoidales bacterium]|nr:right-handed parallel beta-helix repeat-containing protein [Dehalococcoidales bacterium]